MMILTRTPLRISFLGGGSDMPEYCDRFVGKVLSTSIDKYMYVAVNKTSKDHYKVVYDSIEIKKNIEDINHTRVKNVLKRYEIDSGYEISSFCEFPTKGTGLGSSSSYTVALIHSFMNEMKHQELAKEAYDVERNMCGESLGMQDQIATACGGFNKIIMYEGNFKVEPMGPVSVDKLQMNLMMFYTGIRRDANNILVKQADLVRSNDKSVGVLHHMVYQVDEGIKLLNNDRLDDFGHLIGKSWEYKKSMNMSVTNEFIDQYYEDAMKAGAIGGKLLGAGGGGFLLFYVKPENQQRVRDALSDLKEFDFNFEFEGSKVVYNQ